jgi:toxin ParE1/3/4
MTSWELSQEALDDLDAIWTYIARDNPGAADKLEADIFVACERLVRFPSLGHKRPDLTDEAVRFWPVRRICLVVYHLSNEKLVVARILSAGLDMGEEL